MNPQTVSVIIPTYNRRDVLNRVLQAYLRQTRLECVAEILVIDDGSTDGTRDITSAFETQLPIRYLRQANQGPAAARNWGIREAKAPILLFTDDDIIPDPELIATHLSTHDKNADTRVAVQGYVTWSPEIHVTPFMRWYGEHSLFGFGDIAERDEIDFRYFYSCNVSLKADFIRSVGGFDESFKGAAYEDTELAFRLQQAGMKLFYNRNALAYHYQRFTFADVRRRGQRVASGRRVFTTMRAGASMKQRNAQLSHRIAKWLVAKIAILLLPFKPLLDSNIRLPAIVYRILTSYHPL